MTHTFHHTTIIALFLFLTGCGTRPDAPLGRFGETDAQPVREPASRKHGLRLSTAGADSHNNHGGGCRIIRIAGGWVASLESGRITFKP